MLECFLKRTRGSITVMVTLILVPTIFFTGFLVDLARIKLYGSQAVMAADVYGEAVLTNYDNLLKELYGLYSVTQDEEALKAVEDLQNYVASSFKPNEDTIAFNYFGMETEYSGFMPYQNADVTLSYEPAENATLKNDAVLSTQIGDFMKFRIAQQLLDDGEFLMDAIDMAAGENSTAKVFQKKNEVDNKLGGTLKEVEKYYNTLKELNEYPQYIKEMKSSYDDLKTDIENIVNSSSYRIYKDYETNKDAIKEALKREADLEEGETLSSSDKALIEMYEDWCDDSNARRDKLSAKFQKVNKDFEDTCKDYDPVNVTNFEEKVVDLQKQAQVVKKELAEVAELRADLDKEMENMNGQNAEELKERIKLDYEKLDKIFGNELHDYNAKNFIDLADNIEKNQPVNQNYASQIDFIIERAEEIEEAYLDFESPMDYYETFDDTQYDDFQKTDRFKRLYNGLKDTFEMPEDQNEKIKAAKNKQKKADDKKKKAENQLKNDKEKTDARDIPNCISIGESSNTGDFGFTDLISTAASYMNLSSLGEAGNKLLLKFYTISYDFGMFSNRTTNIEANGDDGDASGESGGASPEEIEKAISLTGMELCKSYNYLYGAELEYILGGKKDSGGNLDVAKNRILAFRAVTNLAATFTIDEINLTIKAITAPLSPMLGPVVAAALRGGITLMETAADWGELKKGEEVIVFKTKWQHLQIKDDIEDLLGDLESGSGTGGADAPEPFGMDYEQYLWVMLMVMTPSDKVTSRTADLITLNINGIQQSVGEDEEKEIDHLDFTMDKTVTAVNATCSVHLDFAVMPDGFAEQVVEDDTHNALREYQKNFYKFTVTRGY